MQTDIYVQRKHFHYFAKCRYDERLYAECCSALQSTLPSLTFHLVGKKLSRISIGSTTIHLPRLRFKPIHFSSRGLDYKYLCLGGVHSAKWQRVIWIWPLIGFWSFELTFWGRRCEKVAFYRAVDVRNMTGEIERENLMDEKMLNSKLREKRNKTQSFLRAV